MRSRCVAIGWLTLAAGVVAPASAQLSATCKTVSEAMLRVATTPHHAVATRSNRSEVTESITVGDTNYFKYRGEWKKSPLSPKDNLERERENIRNAKVYTCRQWPDEVVDGVAVAVYTAHSETPDVGASDAKLWISKATGLPRRTESDMVGDGKQHLSIRYDYDNIKAPILK